MVPVPIYFNNCIVAIYILPPPPPLVVEPPPKCWYGLECKQVTKSTPCRFPDHSYHYPFDRIEARIGPLADLDSLLDPKMGHGYEEQEEHYVNQGIRVISNQMDRIHSIVERVGGQLTKKREKCPQILEGRLCKDGQCKKVHNLALYYYLLMQQDSDLHLRDRDRCVPLERFFDVEEGPD